MGIGQGMLPLVGYNFGAQKKQRVGEVVAKATLLSLTWGILCWGIVTLFPIQIMSLFGTDPSFLLGGVPALRMFALGFFAIGVQNNLSSVFQGIGKALPSLSVILPSAHLSGSVPLNPVQHVWPYWVVGSLPHSRLPISCAFCGMDGHCVSTSKNTASPSFKIRNSLNSLSSAR